MRFLSEIAHAFGDTGPEGEPWSVVGEGELPSYFAVTELAAATLGTTGRILAELAGADRAVAVDQRLASLWFGMTLRPQGWSLPPIWDAVAGDYRACDGWIRLHTNAPHHRAAALRVLGVEEDRDGVAKAVEGWAAAELEAEVVAAGGCAAEMRSLEAWAAHPQGRAVAAEPLIAWSERGSVESRLDPIDTARPLEGLRVLDLTRVLAGPVATRFLAGFGAEVLRIDPPDWNEPGVVPEVTLGKRCAGLDLRKTGDRETFEGLLDTADLLIHGYRPGALAGLGYDAAFLRVRNPALIEVTLSAYGWSGPWAGRRGFDSLVQMSSGIADLGMRMSGKDRPFPLPVQALDHATGYLMAAAALHALTARRRSGRVFSARLSLARTAALLCAAGHTRELGETLAEGAADLALEIEATAWGSALRTRFPLEIEGLESSWPHPAGELRSAEPKWLPD